MNLQITKKKLIWLAGTLILGALGSGLWEAVIRPSMLWFVTLMLNLGTLGLSSLRDGIYVDVAKGSYEEAGLALLAMATGLLCGVSTAPLVISLASRARDANGRSTSVVVRVLRKNWMLIAIPLIFGMIFCVNLFRVTYTAQAATYAEQLLQITDPYETERDRLLFRSELSQISSRDDYVRLVNKLKSIAASHNLKIPEFVVY
jgi:hypothetical protein